MKLPTISPSAATIIAGALIALAILFIGRWELSDAALLDRWTGNVMLCQGYAGQPVHCR